MTTTRRARSVNLSNMVRAALLTLIPAMPDAHHDRCLAGGLAARRRGTRAATQEPALDAGVRAEPEQGGLQRIRCRLQAFVGYWVEHVEDEHDAADLGSDTGPGALPPVPAPAGDPRVIAPDDLARTGLLDGEFAVCCGVEGFAAVGADEARCTEVGGAVFTAHRNEMADGDGVVDVGDSVDAR